MCPVIRWLIGCNGTSFFRCWMGSMKSQKTLAPHVSTPSIPFVILTWCPWWFVVVKANVLLTHFGNLKWTHPHDGERESVFRHSERTTVLIRSAMAAQSVPCEEPGIKVAALLFALLTPGSSHGVKNAPI